MSVFIKGMDMPYGCANCSFLNGPVYDCRGRAEYFCNIPIDEICGKSVTDQVIDMYEGGGNSELYFAEWCPLVEVNDCYWIDSTYIRYDGDTIYQIRCSNCGEAFTSEKTGLKPPKTNYCPCCGSRMMRD